VLNTISTRNTAAVWTLFLSLLLFGVSSHAKQTPVERYGALSVKNGKIVGENESVLSVAGVSFFWSNDGWGAEKYYNKKAVEHLVDEWEVSIVRAALGVEYNGGYLEQPNSNLVRVETVIDAAVEQGIYVIIDWHSHKAEASTQSAKAFFINMAKKYGHLPNVIYEIYNEPLADTDWETVIKPYAVEIIAAIRQHDPDNLIVVGTQTWSQDVDKVVQSPITGVENLVYTLHFYAGTHKESLITRAQKAIDMGLPIMVTEWGSMEATANGEIDYESTQQWLDFMKKNQLTFCSWALNSKAETASFLKPSASATGPWDKNDLTENGRFLKKIIKSW
jgi:endoglucanase